MKILLVAINSKYIHSNLAVYSLKENAGEYRDSIVIKEFTINNTKESILQALCKEKPDMLFFSVYIWNVEYVCDISREFNKIFPHVPVFAGGPEVSYETEAFMNENPQFEGVLRGEGEETFRETLDAFSDGSPLTVASVRGLSFRSEGFIIHNLDREVCDMNTLKFAYNPDEDFSNRIIYYESSRGCPFNCSYCLSSVDKKVRFKDLDRVKEELLFFIKKKVPQVKFVDRTFNCDRERTLEIWKFIKENDNSITNFHFEIAADLITEDELNVIKDMRPGLVQFEIGVQSVNEATISEIHRTMKLETVKDVVLKVQKNGNIHEHLDLIAGLPYEDFESFKHSFNEIYALKPDQLQLGFLKVLKGSFMYEHAKEYGIKYLDYAPYEVLSTKWISYEEIMQLKGVEEMVEVYYNSFQFSNAVKILETLFPDAFSMFEALSDYYEKNNLFDLSHSRNRRADILLEFVRSIDASKAEYECIKEALVHDIYLRENAKTRPSFADDEKEWKKLSFELCKNGKMQHLEGFHYDFTAITERTIDKILKRNKDLIYVMYHYEDRNPLNNQARVEIKEDIS